MIALCVKNSVPQGSRCSGNARQSTSAGEAETTKYATHSLEACFSLGISAGQVYARMNEIRYDMKDYCLRVAGATRSPWFRSGSPRVLRIHMVVG